MSSSYKQVRFALPHARPPHPDERFTLKCFSRHLSRCTSCVLSESEYSVRCSLCPKGQGYADDLLVYLCYQDGCYRSLVEWPTPVIIDRDYRQAGVYLRFLAAQRRARVSNNGSNMQSRHSTAVRSAWVEPPSLTITPLLSSVTTDSSTKDTVLHLTVPSFEVPIRIRHHQLDRSGTGQAFYRTAEREHY